MDQPVNKSLAIKYFDGLCTPEEAAAVDKWLKEDGNERRLQQWLWEDWQESQGSMPEEDVLRLRWKIDQQLFPGQDAPVRRLVPWQRYGIAAAVILILAVAGAVFLETGNDHKASDDNIAAAYTDSIVNGNKAPYKTTLADGSIVWLNNGAALYIAADFNKNERRVKLKGEAFFEIKEDAVRPFYTEAGNTNTRVLGTSYNIEAYPTEKEVRVSLLSGRIAVHSADTACVLSPGQMAFCTTQTGAMQVGSIATSDPSAWIKGKIVLNKILLPDALDRLSRLYNIPILYNYDHIKEMYITGEFDRDALPVVLQSILFVHNLKFNLMSNGSYLISGNRNKNNH